MIRFSCHCNHQFELPEDMSGRQIQCPVCHRLVDVPTHNELNELSEDGTFNIADPAQELPQAFDRMRVAYAKKKVDEDGVEIDLRQTHEELLAAGTEADIHEYERNPTAPKYDPETGELVRPLDIVEDPNPQPHPSEIPEAKTTLNYAPAELSGTTSLSGAFINLLAPINLAAMFFVFLCHIFFFFSAFIPYLVFAGVFLVGPALIAHYANVVEEVGIEERDEVPRFLRQLSLMDDIWLPFVHVFFAWMICFWPSAIVSLIWTHSVAGTIASLSLDIAGFVFFPAVVLTTITSGSPSNLRPDRIFGVIGLIGTRYAFLVILYAVAMTLYSFGMVTIPMRAIFFILNIKSHSQIFTTPIGYGCLICGIFLMHYFAWLLGLCFRNLHMKFPWVYHGHNEIIPGVNAPRYKKYVRGFPEPKASGARRRNSQA